MTMFIIALVLCVLCLVYVFKLFYEDKNTGIWAVVGWFEAIIALMYIVSEGLK